MLNADGNETSVNSVNGLIDNKTCNKTLPNSKLSTVIEEDEATANFVQLHINLNVTHFNFPLASYLTNHCKVSPNLWLNHYLTQKKFLSKFQGIYN